MTAPASIRFEIEFEGKKYTGCVDEEAIAVFEDMTDRSIIEVAGSPGRPPKLSLLGAFLAATLSRHHPGLTRIDGMKMLREPGVQEKLMGGLSDAMPQPGDTPDAEGAGETPPENPPQETAGKGGKTA